MLNTPELIEVKLLGNEGIRKTFVRMPSDQEWIERQRKRPIEVRVLGRGRSETKVRDSREEDLRLYNVIRCENSLDLDEYEASLVINNIAKADTLSVEKNPDGYMVKVETVAGVLEVVMKTPSVRDWQIYSETRSRIISSRTGTEIFINLASGGRLFDACVLEARQIPVIWKAAAANALIDEIEASFAGDDQEDLFRD